MFRSLILTTKFVRSNQNQTFVRYIRGISRHTAEPKFLKGKVKTVTQYDDSSRIQSYKDFINNIKETELEDELDVEKEMLNEDYQGDVIERCDKYYDFYESEEKSLKASIKKKIIGRKYFKLDRETNLLTNAAKEQIRFLHKSDPLVWNCKALSECFPISEEGAKKLLKCNFTLTSPEKIKAHDEKVAALWKILKSGEPTDLITPLTQKLYKEGKLVDDYFSGNPNLPTAPPVKKVIEIKKKKKVGEFSAIVQTYVEYETQKLLTDGKENADENQLSLRHNSVLESSKMINKINKKIREFKFEPEENNNKDPEVYPDRKKINTNISSEIPFSQFKEILRDETTAKLDKKHKNEYDEYIMQQTSLTDAHIPTNKPIDTKDCFMKIPKFDKSSNIEVSFERNKNVTKVYKFDEVLGYQYPVGKNFKGKINLSPMQRKKGKLHKAGQCVYDENGEFLYKVPT